jgi:hypothetical protein
MINLDFLCMKTAQEMVACKGEANDKENVATNALGVLLENGPYGLMLYLETCSDRQKQIAIHYQIKLRSVCSERDVQAYVNDGTEGPSGGDFNGITVWLRAVAQDLDRYLFVKTLWQQTLTYARYHAKALNAGKASAQSTEEEDVS